MKKLTNNPIFNYAQLLCVKISLETENQINRLLDSNATFFVFFDRGIDVMRFDEKNARFASFVNNRRYKGVTLFVKRGKVEKVEKDNWDKIRRLISPKREYIPNDVEYRERKQEHEKLFEIGSECVRYHKPSKRGFYKTQTANETQYKMRFINTELRRIEAAI